MQINSSVRTILLPRQIGWTRDKFVSGLNHLQCSHGVYTRIRAWRFRKCAWGNDSRSPSLLNFISLHSQKWRYGCKSTLNTGCFCCYFIFFLLFWIDFFFSLWITFVLEFKYPFSNFFWNEKQDNEWNTSAARKLLTKRRLCQKSLFL